MHTSEWSRHWRDIEHVREQCGDPNTCVGGDATVSAALQHVQQHEPALWDAFATAAAKAFSEGGSRPSRDMSRAVELALDHYLSSRIQGRAA